MRFIAACLGRKVDSTPVWLMRQAGRYLPEYKALRERVSFYEMCTNVDLIVEATLQPLRRFDLDAAIIFSDILIPVAAMGVNVEFAPEPRLSGPIRTKQAIRDLRTPNPQKDLSFLLTALDKVRSLLKSNIALIGFAGAPFTIAAYMIEGGTPGDLLFTKQWMFRDPAGFRDLLAKISDIIAAVLEAQLLSGADAVQLFDTWAGLLAPEDYKRFALPAARSVIERIKTTSKPVVYYAKNSAGILHEISKTGADCVGLDFTMSLEEAISRLGGTMSVQGNLDPMVLFGQEEEIRKRVREIVTVGRNARGHVFNLGHGIHKDTPVSAVEVLVDEVRKSGSRKEGLR